MKHQRDKPRLGPFVAFAAAAILEGAYLLVLFARNVPAFRDARVHWARDLARESGIAGVIWLVLVAGLVTLIVTLLARSGSIALFLVVGILVGCLGLELSALVERRNFDRTLDSMTNLRQAGFKILEESRSSTGGLALDPPPAIVAEDVFRDGWGHPLRYARISRSQAFLIAPGSDGLVEADVRAIKREDFPPSRFDHDIIVEIADGEVRFVVYPNGPEQGIPCTIYAALGCFSYWR
jgi:hypothetical protein